RRGRKASETELRAVFLAWHTRARKFLRPEQSRDEYEFEFLEGYDRAKYPLGEGPLADAWRGAKDKPLPRVALEFDDPRIHLVIAVCRELQRVCGREPFFLSCRMVQKLMPNVPHTTANIWLNGLVRCNILKVVEKGGPVS